MKQEKRDTELEYRPDIDGIRAISVLAVLIFHAFPHALPGGFVGVDVFFVISGYLITGIILKSTHRGRFSFLQFYASRVRRIFPALILVILFTLLVGFFVQTPNNYSSLGQSGAASAAFYANVAIYVKSFGYFFALQGKDPLLHIWSLGIEEQFYAIWPLVVVGAFYFLARPILGVLAICFISIAISLGVSLFTSDVFSTASFYLPFARAWELLIGASIVILGGSDRTRDLPAISLATNILSIAGLVMIVYAALEFKTSDPYPGWRAVIPVSGAALLLVSKRSFLNKSILSWSPATFVGKISYPLYLWHWPLLVYATTLSMPFSLNTSIFFSILLSFVAATLTYKHIEQPLRSRFSVRNASLGLAATMAGVWLCCLSITHYDGLLWRGGLPLGSEVVNAANYEIPNNQRRTPGCTEFFGLNHTPSACLITAPGKQIDFVVIGDSHSMAIFGALRASASASEKNMALIAHGGCPPLLWSDRDGSKCQDEMRETFQGVLSKSEVGSVVLVGFFESYFSRATMWSGALAGTVPTSVEFRKGNFESSLVRSVDAIRQASKKTIIVQDNPELDLQIPSYCLKGGDDNCSIPRNSIPAAARDYIFEAQNRLGFTTVDLWAALCDDRLCRGKKDGLILYQDSSHLNPNGAAYLAAGGFASGLTQAIVPQIQSEVERRLLAR